MDETLRKLQLIQLEMLKVVDNICSNHKIKYSLYAGTLLGAVRHKGFIPWDDDLDVCMPRKDYNRFIKICGQCLPKEYCLQNKENEPRFSQSFTKMRKKHTTFLQGGEPVSDYHHGIFIDIFPIDRMPKRTISRMFFLWNGMKYQLLTREFIPPKESKIVKMVAKCYLKMIAPRKREQKRKKLLDNITRYNNRLDFPMAAIETYKMLRCELPNDLFDSLVMLKFEGKEYMCFKKWDEYLKIVYDNYMKFPPKEERIWKHSPIRLDFEHDFDEIKSIKEKE